MKTTGLDKLYSRLDAAKHYRILMQAIVRGDEAERDRVFGSSPWVTVRVPDLEGVLVLLHIGQDGAGMIGGWLTTDATCPVRVVPRDASGEMRLREAHCSR